MVLQLDKLNTYATGLLDLLRTSTQHKTRLHKTQIHAQGIEGRWKHAKAHVNACGGSRANVLQERLDEYIFHRTYLRDAPTNVHVLRRLLAKYRHESFKFVN